MAYHTISKLARRELARIYRNGRFATSARCFYEDGYRDELVLRKDLCLPGLHLDDIDKLMGDEPLPAMERYYPNLDIAYDSHKKPFDGHNLMVIQPWQGYTNMGLASTTADLQLEECVSLGNTIQNWKVVDKKIIFSNQLNRKHVFGSKTFEELKDYVRGRSGISAMFFGVELLSAIQLSSLESELQMPVFDRFTVVLNIFRQHARTKEAKVQLALAEIPYIRSHLREIHDSPETLSSSSDALKMLIGGTGDRHYTQRLGILKRRESKLKTLLVDIQKQRDITKKARKKLQWPTVSVVGYTNSGKTSLIKHLTEDQDMAPKDQLFATLDVTVHKGQLPSHKNVMFVDTVGFISRVPTLLLEAFSVTLKEVRESDMILHVFDINHPDHKLQHETVTKALTTLHVSNEMMKSTLTVGNKIDLVNPGTQLPKCDISISVANNINMDKLAQVIDKRLKKNLDHEEYNLRVENGGKKYMWLLKNATITDCIADKQDGNYLICTANLSPMARGRWIKLFGKLESASDVE